MKKILFAIVAVAALAFVACDKEDGEKKDSGALEGTTWEGTEYYDDEFETLRLQFRTDSRVVATETYGDMYGYSETESYAGTYKANGSTVTMTFDDDGWDWTMTGKIDGSSMDIYDEGDYWITVKKK